MNPVGAVKINGCVCMIRLDDYLTHELNGINYRCGRVRYKGTFAGVTEKIPYLKKPGVNCIELLPIFEFDELENPRTYNGERLYNYRGYSTVNFFSPKAGYAASAPLGLAAEELKNMVKKFHAAVRNHILDCLRYWIADYHIDGFRFDLASILSRDSEGAPMSSPPLIEALAHDPVLGKAKLIAEAWDAGGLYQVGSFHAWGRWAEWNGKYRDCLRTLFSCNQIPVRRRFASPRMKSYKQY